MKRTANSIATLTLAAMLMGLVGGCAAWRNGNEKIVRIQATQNPDKAARLTQVGIKALAAGNTELASNKFLAAIDADMAYGPAHNNLGLMHYEQGNLYQAVLAFEEAMNLMDQDPTVLYNLAITLEAAGKVHEALDLYMQAVEMDPVNPNFLGNLVRLRIRMGDNDPTLVAQLQDLILIETRAEWRSWADSQLALNFNPLLDRGPDTPEFDLNTENEKVKDKNRDVDDQIIDLTPGESLENDLADSPVIDQPSLQSYEPSSSSPILSAPESNPIPVPQPMPIFDDAPVETLPPSIQLNPDDLPVEMDYFR